MRNFLVLALLGFAMVVPEVIAQSAFHYIDSLNKMASDMYYQHPDSGKIMAEKAQRLSEAEKYSKGEAQALSMLAVAYADQSQYKTAFSLLHSAMEIAENSNDPEIKKSVFLRAGVVYYENYVLDKAIEVWLKSLELAKADNDNPTLAKTLSNIGAVFYEKEDLTEALKYFEQALMIIEQIGDNAMAEIALGNIGNIYVKLNKYPMAEDYYLRKERLIKNKGGEFENALWNYIALTRVYLKQNNKEKAEFYIDEMKRFVHLRTKKGLVTDYYEVLAGYNLMQHDTSEAIKNYKKSIQLADSSGLYVKLAGTAGRLSALYKEKSDFQNALHYAEMAKVATDSSDRRANSDRILQIKANHDFKQFEQELTAKNLRQRMVTLAIVIVLLAAIGAAVYLMFKHKQRASAIYLDKKVIEEHLKNKEQEILSKSLQLSEREELLKKMEQKLTELSKSAKKTNVPAIRELIAGIRQSKNDNIFSELEQRFTVINGDFLDRLKAEFPDLTPRELLVCSYLRLNMSSKEIATITHQSPESVNKARFRLRKKLNLNKSDVNLTEFLINY